MSPLLMNQSNLAARFMASETIVGKLAKSSPFGFGGGAADGPDPSALIPEPAPIRAARPVSYARPAASSSLPMVPIAIGVLALGLVAVVVLKKKKKR